MVRAPPQSTRTDPPLPYPTLFRSPVGVARGDHDVGLRGGDHPLDRGLVYRVRQRDDPTEGRTLVALEGALVGVGETVGHRRAARVGVLDDRDRGTAGGRGEVVGEAPRGIGVEEVEVAERHAAVLLHTVPPRGRADGAVAGAGLVGVLAVAEVLHGPGGGGTGGST